MEDKGKSMLSEVLVSLDAGVCHISESLCVRVSHFIYALLVFTFAFNFKSYCCLKESWSGG